MITSDGHSPKKSNKKWLMQINPRYLVWRYLTKAFGTDKLLNQIFNEPPEELYMMFKSQQNLKQL